MPYGSSSSPCPASWEGIDLDQAGTNLINGWTHGTVADNGLALGASSSDSYGWKKFASDSASSNGDPFLAVTYTTDGPATSLAAKHAGHAGDADLGREVRHQGDEHRLEHLDAATATGTSCRPTAYYAYGGKGKDGTEVHGSPVFTAMPSTVAPGQSVTVDAAVDALPAALTGSSSTCTPAATGGTPMSFDSQGDPAFAIGLYVPAAAAGGHRGVPADRVHLAARCTPQLSTTASRPGPARSPTSFTLTCEPLPGRRAWTASIDSGYFQPVLDAAGALTWNGARPTTVDGDQGGTGNGSSTTVGPVTITPEVPQPAITLGLGDSDGQDFDPAVGNYTTSATDAAVAAAGPAAGDRPDLQQPRPAVRGRSGPAGRRVARHSAAQDNDGTR